MVVAEAFEEQNLKLGREFREKTKEKLQPVKYRIESSIPGKYMKPQGIRENSESRRVGIV